MQTIIYKSDMTAVGDDNPLPVIIVQDSGSSFSSNVSSDNALVPVRIKAGTSGKSIYVGSVLISSQIANEVTLKDSSGTIVGGPFYVAAATPFTASFSPAIPVTAARDLNFVTSKVTQITVLVTGNTI
jgi:hypothetical protein